MYLLLTLALAPPTPMPVLKHSDVVFMDHASRDVYRAYGATVLAWGGLPTPDARKEAEGARWFGSVGMVTEFSRYYERDPATYEQGLCRDVRGNPVKVPWLTDHRHKGIPYWWCCTQQPRMRDFVRDRVIETVKAGADGIHIDDHLGTSGGLWLGICFCDRCVEGFRTHLASLPRAELQRLGIGEPTKLDFRAEAVKWLDAEPGRQVTRHPLWPEWEVYQTRAAAAFMQELRDLAARTAGRPVPVGANAGLLWPRHLADYQALDLFSAETDHHASERKPSDAPVFAYRLAEAVGRPYAATASGWDWAYIKEHNLPGLVRCWIALSYASGQRLMAPHRQWCYTEEKGTHWYEGPADKFAPLYRFVRDNAALFDGYRTLADVGVVAPYADFTANPGRWIAMGQALSAANISYSVLLAGDRVVPKRLSPRELQAVDKVIVADTRSMEAGDRRAVEAWLKRRGSGHAFASAEEAVRTLRPAVRVTADAPIRTFARVKRGSAVVHLLNYAYDASKDDVKPASDIAVSLDLDRLGVKGANACRLIRPGRPVVTLTIDAGTVRIPEVDLWAILELRSASGAVER